MRAHFEVSIGSMEASISGSAEHDGAVRETASDASLCKLSASQLGYYADPFVQFFVKAPSRRMPIINRGYYARVAAVESLVQVPGRRPAQVPGCDPRCRAGHHVLPPQER